MVRLDTREGVYNRKTRSMLDKWLIELQTGVDITKKRKS